MAGAESSFRRLEAASYIPRLSLIILIAGACAKDVLLPPLRSVGTSLFREWKVAMPGGTGFEIYTDMATTSSLAVFVASNRTLAAVNRADGSVRWTAPGSYSTAKAVVISRDVATVAKDTVVAFDLETGMRRWTYWAGSPAWNCRPSSNATVVVVCTDDWRIIAIDQATGAVRWTRELRDSLGGIPTVVGTVISGDTVYAAVKQRFSPTNGFTVGLFFAIALSDGRLLREFRDGNYTDFTGYVGTPTVVGPLLIVPHLLSNKITAINRFTGQVAWRVFSDPGWEGFLRFPTVVDGVIYGASGDRRVYAIDAATGIVRWKSEILEGSQELAFACGSVVLTWTGLNLRALDRATGNFLGSVADELTDETQVFSSAPAVDGKDLFVRSVREVRKYSCP